MLDQAGWIVQSKTRLIFLKGKAWRFGVSNRHGPADYVLFVDRIPVGVIEAKREEAGESITEVELQSSGYAKATLKYNLNAEPLPFVYESTGALTRFTDYRDPHPRSREVFHFHRPETLAEWFGQEKTLRARLKDLPALDVTGLRKAQIKAIKTWRRHLG